MAIALRTARLLLRPWRDDDIAAFAAMSADPAVMEFLLPLPGRAARKRAQRQEHGFGQRVVERPGEASFIGVVGLETVSYEAPFTPSVEVAWRLTRRHWGQGYANEAHGALGMTRSPEDDVDHRRLTEGPLRRHVLYRLSNTSTAPRVTGQRHPDRSHQLDAGMMASRGGEAPLARDQRRVECFR